MGSDPADLSPNLGLHFDSRARFSGQAIRRLPSCSGRSAAFASAARATVRCCRFPASGARRRFRSGVPIDRSVRRGRGTASRRTLSQAGPAGGAVGARLGGRSWSGTWRSGAGASTASRSATRPRKSTTPRSRPPRRASSTRPRSLGDVAAAVRRLQVAGPDAAGRRELSAAGAPEDTRARSRCSTRPRPLRGRPAGRRRPPQIRLGDPRHGSIRRGGGALDAG
jgi:hypothetical protein